MDPVARRDQLGGGEYGHITWANKPVSRRTELSDLLNVGFAGDSTQIANVMHTLSGPFCYSYV